MAEELYFTLPQLKKLKKKDLFKVASYYKIEVKWNWTKKKLVEAIWETFNPPEVEEAEMSVRVKRIKESVK